MIRVFDDVLIDPAGYREKALAKQYSGVALGPDRFDGIAPCDDMDLLTAINHALPEAEPSLTFFRKSPAGQIEPNYIHSDAEMGEWTGIYYLNPDPPGGDGTTFWESPDGDVSGEWTPKTAKSARLRVGWEPWRHVEARFNRLVMFSADLFHSRALYDNYGSGDDARLIQVVFGRWSV